MAVVRHPLSPVIIHHSLLPTQNAGPQPFQTWLQTNPPSCDGRLTGDKQVFGDMFSKIRLYFFTIDSNDSYETFRKQILVQMLNHVGKSRKEPPRKMGKTAVGIGFVGPTKTPQNLNGLLIS